VEGIIKTVIENSVVAGGFIILLSYLLTRFTKQLDDMGITLKGIDTSMSNFNLNMTLITNNLERIDKEMRSIEERLSALERK